MKIVFIVNSFPRLSETFILNQITGLLDMGHKVEIFSLKNSSEKKAHSKVKKYRLTELTYCCKMPKNPSFRVVKAIFLFIKFFPKKPWEILESLNFFKYREVAIRLYLFYALIYFPKKNKNFDIIHCQFGYLGFIGMMLKKIQWPKAKLVISFRGYDITKYIERNGYNIYKELFDKGDLFLPVSNFFKKKLKKIGCKEKKIIVHRSGIDCNKFTFPKARKIINNKHITLLSIGRLVEKKGFEYSVRAFAMILRERKKYNIKYKIIGDGPLFHKLKSLTYQLKINEEVEFLGEKNHEEVLNILQHSHILIAPSVTAQNGDQEGIPNVLKEGMATGIPIVSTLHSGIPELISNNKLGFLTPERNIGALKEKIECLIDHPELWEEMGNTGRKFIEKNYNIDILNHELAKIYEMIITNDKNKF
jgi:colanic acid/amylovoran biosynthesis glycosyltransferase